MCVWPDFLGFGRRRSSSCFHAYGKFPILRQALKFDSVFAGSQFSIILTISPEKPSGPGAFPSLMASGPLLAQRLRKVLLWLVLLLSYPSISREEILRMCQLVSLA